MNLIEFNVNNFLVNVVGGDKGIVFMEDMKLVNCVKILLVKGSNLVFLELLYDFFV